MMNQKKSWIARGAIVTIIGIMIAVVYFLVHVIDELEQKMNRFHRSFILCARWLAMDLDGKWIENKLVEQGIREVAIYGNGLIGKALLARLIHSENITVKMTIDKNKNGSTGIPVIGLDDEIEGVDAIIVSLPTEFIEIRRQLSKKCTVRIVGIDDFFVE